MPFGSLKFNEAPRFSVEKHIPKYSKCIHLHSKIQKNFFEFLNANLGWLRHPIFTIFSGCGVYNFNISYYILVFKKL